MQPVFAIKHKTSAVKPAAPSPLLHSRSNLQFFARPKPACILHFWSSIYKPLKLVWKDLVFSLFRLEHFCNILEGTGSYAVAFKVLILFRGDV